jgi:hypothetical protein
LISNDLVEMPRFLIIQYLSGSHCWALFIMIIPDPPVVEEGSGAEVVATTDGDTSAAG